MRNYVFEFEQIVLRNKFFSDPKKFFEDAQLNPKYYFYKLFKKFESDVNIASDLKLESIWSHYLTYEGIQIIDLQGFAYHKPNCANNMYFFYDEETEQACYCFSADSMKFDSKEDPINALYVVPSLTKLEVYPCDFDVDINIQYNFEFRLFLARFMEDEDIYLPPIRKMNRIRKFLKFLREFKCEKCQKEDYAYDLSGIPQGKEYLALCPHCLTFSVQTK